MRADDITPNGPHGPFVALALQRHEVRHKTLEVNLMLPRHISTLPTTGRHR